MREAGKQDCQGEKNEERREGKRRKEETPGGKMIPVHLKIFFAFHFCSIMN